MVTEVLIWLGNVQNESSMLCGFTTAFLHCAFLCTISWIFLEGKRYTLCTTQAGRGWSRWHGNADANWAGMGRQSFCAQHITMVYDIRADKMFGRAMFAEREKRHGKLLRYQQLILSGFVSFALRLFCPDANESRFHCHAEH